MKYSQIFKAILRFKNFVIKKALLRTAMKTVRSVIACALHYAQAYLGQQNSALCCFGKFVLALSLCDIKGKLIV